MIDKKKLLIELLNKIKDIWPTAEGILIALETLKIDEEDIDRYLGMLQQAQKESKNDIDKAKFGKAMDFLEQLKQKEVLENKNLQQELDAILAQI